MSARATTLAYVRTPGGVIQVQAGEAVPDDAIAEHIETLAEAGVVELVDAPQPASAGLAKTDAVRAAEKTAPAPVVAPPARGRTTAAATRRDRVDGGDDAGSTGGEGDK